MLGLRKDVIVNVVMDIVFRLGMSRMTDGMDKVFVNNEIIHPTSEFHTRRWEGLNSE